MVERYKWLWQPQADVYQARTQFWLVIGCVATYCYAFFTLQFTTMAMWSHNLAVLALLVSLFSAPKLVRKEPVVWLLLLIGLLAVFSYVKTNLLIPEYAEPRPYFNKLFGVFGFFVIAWWLGGDMRRVLVMLGLALAGFGAALIIHGSGGDIEVALAGGRPAFGFQNWQHAAMFFSVALMGWCVFSIRFLRAKGVTVMRYVGWAGILAVLFTGVVVTQTRAAWLGLLAAMVVAGVFGMVRSRGNQVLNRTLVAMVATGVTVLVLVGWVAKPILDARLAAEHQVVEQVASGKIENLPETSIGIRIKLWTEGLNWIRARPWTGWGYTIRERFIADSPNLSPFLKENFGHIHSSYLEILLIWGMLGMVLYGALIGYVSVRVWKTWRAGGIPSDVALFGFCFFAYWLVVNLFESYVFGKTGTYLTAMVVGSVYTFPLAERLRRSAPEQVTRKGQ